MANLYEVSTGEVLRGALNGFHPRVFEDFRTGLHGRARESRNIARRIASRADFIDHASVINGRPDLGTQLMLLHDSQRVVELAGDDFGLPRIVVEMLLLASDLEMAAPGEVALNAFFLNDLLDAVHRGE